MIGITLSIALTFFLVTNPVGNSPAIIALVRHYPLERQKKILLREGFITLILALFFQYLGDDFLYLIGIENFSLTLCGGLLLFFVALNMIFADRSKDESELKTLPKEPFIVPIATPLLSGPGLLTMIMLFSKKESNLIISSAIFISWIGTMAVLLIAPYLQKIIGKRGLLALEQLMGMILAMMSMEMIVQGADLFVKTLGI